MGIPLEAVFVEARELQLQQRVWHVEALAEEAAAREVAGHQAEAPKQKSPQKNSMIFHGTQASPQITRPGPPYREG